MKKYLFLSFTLSVNGLISGCDNPEAPVKTQECREISVAEKAELSKEEQQANASACFRAGDYQKSPKKTW
ncbi:entry exclusion lipoprotein TrbK [Xenorhabdus bovienii]|uniref:entry exclusion lipoprotein TrbK n=1 Tax=Xenorhabdus bovienii TaxID=40576 RepID=UPI003DA388B0